MDEFDWLSSNAKTAYPFTERQPDNTHELFVDAAVFDSTTRALPNVTLLHHFVSTLGSESVQLTCGSVVTNLNRSNASFRRTVFGAYTIFEWSRSTVNDTVLNTVFSPSGSGFTDVDQSVKLVVLTAALGNFSADLALAEGILIPSLVNPLARGVRRLFVRLPDLITPTIIRFFEAFEDKVVFRPGFNTNLTAVKQTALQAAVPRAKRQILVDIVPGGGQGYFVNCDPSQHPGIRTVNHVPPNDLGNLTLEGEDCVWVETLLNDVLSESSPFPFTEYIGLMQDGKLALHNSCSACCDCTDYQNAYEAVRNVWNKAKIIATHVERMRKDYNALVPVITDIAMGPGVRGACGTVIVQAIPTANYQVSVTLTFENTTNNWLVGNVFETTMKHMPGFRAVPGSGQWLTSDQPGQATAVDPVVADVYNSPTDADTRLQVTLAYAKPQTRYSYRFSGRFNATSGFTRNNSPVALIFDFKNENGSITDPNNPASAQNPTPCSIQAQTTVALVGPPSMT